MFLIELSSFMVRRTDVIHCENYIKFMTLRRFLKSQDYPVSTIK